VVSEPSGNFIGDHGSCGSVVVASNKNKDKRERQKVENSEYIKIILMYSQH